MSEANRDNAQGSASINDTSASSTSDGDYEDAQVPRGDGDENRMEQMLLKLADDESAPRASNNLENGSIIGGNGDVLRQDGSEHADEASLHAKAAVPGLNSPKDSISETDRPPSIEGSVTSPPGTAFRGHRASSIRSSSYSSLQPFDRRFQTRLDPTPLGSPRSQSPAFYDGHSRQSSFGSHAHLGRSEEYSASAPWDAVRWIKLRNIGSQVFSEPGKRSFGLPTCLTASTHIALGMSKGAILVFDFSQNLKAVLGPGTEAVKSGPVVSLAFSADKTTIAGGHASGSIFTWEVSRPAKPFLHVPAMKLDASGSPQADGHVFNTAVLHVGFLGARRTALVSADGKGMAFSHLATRGLGSMGRSMRTTRILGRYPHDTTSRGRPRKPSAVLAFSALPLGNVEEATDTMGLVAILTPYLLVIISTMPIAQTQHKAGRPKDIAAHSALSGSLAWFPAVRLRSAGEAASESKSRTKLVYCWNNVLTVLEMTVVAPSEEAAGDRPPTLSFRARSRWKNNESIVAVQWLSRSMLVVLTITQQLVVLQDESMIVTETVDLISWQLSHVDFFSRHLQSQAEQDDEDDPSTYDLVADAYFMSFLVSRKRVFLLGKNDLFVGVLSSWKDRLDALMAQSSFVDAIRLATRYYLGEVDPVTVGLPNDVSLRCSTVREKLLEIIAMSLDHTFGMVVVVTNDGASQFEGLANACFAACTAIKDTDFLFAEVYDSFEQGSATDVFLETLGSYVLDGQILSVPPGIIKNLINYNVAIDAETRLEEMICRMDTTTMDIDQITSLCRENKLYDAFLFIWNQALGDYITPLAELMSIIARHLNDNDDASDVASTGSLQTVNALKIFPYLAYSLTGRVYPTGSSMDEASAQEAKIQLYSFLFSGGIISWPKVGGKLIKTRVDSQPESSFPYMHLLLRFDAPSFLSSLNEAFEDSFLNGPEESPLESSGATAITDSQFSGRHMNRQQIISILQEVMSTDEFSSSQTIYLDMFIARNFPKFPQFMLLSGTALQRVLINLCDYPSAEVAEDCQLSVEYLLSMHRPVDLDDLLPRFKRAGFYRVLKSLHKADRQYGKLLPLYFEDDENQHEVFLYLEDYLRRKNQLRARQAREAQAAVERHAFDFISLDAAKTASIVNTYAPELHVVFLKSAASSPNNRFIYLRTILEPALEGSAELPRVDKQYLQEILEEYVRLLCVYDASHVADYIHHLQSGQLRLEQVLPDMEDEGVVDAAVILVAREGRVRDAMDRLLNHLKNLEAALLGLIRPSENGETAVHEKQKAIEEVLGALEKYTQVGIWLCQRQMRSLRGSKCDDGRSLRSKPLTEEQLTLEERLWLDLISATVHMVTSTTGSEAPLDEASGLETMHSEGPNVTAAVRTLVQQTFTALLTNTTSKAHVRLPEPSSGVAEHTRSSALATSASSTRPDFFFLRVLRAFLTRASVSSPSLSHLRAVLASIFSAYAYEESLLALSNNLLQKDLFFQVTALTEQRQRGWRPRSQTCDGCGRRVWGPGAGATVWEAWRLKTAARAAHRAGQQGSRLERAGKLELDADMRAPAGPSTDGAVADRAPGRAGKARGKPGGRTSGDRVPSRPPPAQQRQRDDGGESRRDLDDGAHSEDGLDALVSFSCQHIFHRKCLDRLSSLRSAGKSAQAATAGGRIGAERLECAICEPS